MSQEALNSISKGEKRSIFAVFAAQESGAECPAKRSRNKRTGLKKRVQQYLDRIDLGELKLYGGLVVKFPVK